MENALAVLHDPAVIAAFGTEEKGLKKKTRPFSWDGGRAGRLSMRRGWSVLVASGLVSTGNQLRQHIKMGRTHSRAAFAARLLVPPSAALLCGLSTRPSPSHGSPAKRLADSQIIIINHTCRAVDAFVCCGLREPFPMHHRAPPSRPHCL